MQQPKNNGKRVWAKVGAALSAMALVACGSSGGSETNDVLRVGYDILKPLLDQDDDGNMIGPAAILIEEIADRNGLEVEWIQTSWPAIVPAIQSGQVDISGMGMNLTEERKEAIDFVVFGESGTCVGVEKDNQELQTVEDLNDPSVRIGTAKGSSGYSIFKELFPDADVGQYEVTGSGQPVQQLFAGDIDATAIDADLAGQYMNAYPGLRIIPEIDECQSDPLHPTPFGLGISKDNPNTAAYQEIADELADELEAARAELIAELNEEPLE